MDLPDGVVLPDPPVMVPTGPQVPTVDGPPAGVGLGPNPKSATNDRVVRTEDKLLNQRNDFRDFLKKSNLQGNPLLETLASTQDSLAEDKRVKVVVKDNMVDKGMYDPNTHTIYLRSDQVNNLAAVTHEAYTRCDAARYRDC